MGFLIKSAFWLSLVLLVLPLGGGSDGDLPTVGPVETFFAARGAVEDMSGMCERRPEVCAVGRSALQTIGARAREGARIAYSMMEEPQGADAQVSTAGMDPDADAAIVTGSVATPQPALR